jgi:hypothetical protein
MIALSKTFRPARMQFVEAVSHIRENANKRKIDITDSLIVNKLGISEDQFKDYYERNFLPENLFQTFESVFSEFYTKIIVTEVSYEEIPDPTDEEESSYGK